ncbi:hypothetical protein I9X18_03660 [Campylobacter jejuni]|nr:hypothetical protein [Campylobacter jejuni]MBX1091512.1 hypothetical protein [Campylobacter jejuni]MBX1270335.1 hypothetical protein [Campylobacter jejuni]MBX1279919.1 hypothetical protein [Campylobacter jejuni]HDX3797628.1 hypothetical protein [Campylobacter jejuni]
MEKLIIASRGDGLGERILAILNALYLSKCANYKFGFIWPDHFLTYNNNSNNKILFAISDLQKEEFMFDKIFIEKYSYKNKLRLPNGEMYLGGEGFFLKNDKLSLEEFKNGKYFQYDWGLVCNQFDLTNIFTDLNSEDYYSYLPIAWNCVKFSKEIQTSLTYADRISELVLNKDYIAIHIRSGDIIYGKDRIWNYFGLKKALSIHLVIEIINKEVEPSKTIVIFSDDLESALSLKAYFKDRIIYLVDDLIDEKLTSTQRSFFEINLMSNAICIYSSGNSGFSLLASRIKNTKLISVYSLFDDSNKREIILKYIEDIKLSNYQKAFSYLHVFVSLRNSKDFSFLENIINKILQLDNMNKTYDILYMDLLIEQKKYLCVDMMLRDIISNQEEIFFKCLTLFNFYNYTFLYNFFIKKIFTIQEILQYPNIYYVVYRLSSEYKHNKYFLNIFNGMSEKINLVLDFHNVLNKICFKKKGAVASVKLGLRYRLGFVILSSRKNFTHLVLLPISLFAVVMAYKYEKKYRIKNNIILESGPENIFYDYEDSKKTKMHLCYKLGNVVLNSHKDWKKGGYFKLFFKIYKVWRKHNQRINNGN